MRETPGELFKECPRCGSGDTVRHLYRDEVEHRCISCGRLYDPYSRVLQAQIADSLRPRPVLTKTNFVERYLAGEFGNHSPSWTSLEELFNWEGFREALLDDVNVELAGGERNLYHLRNRVAGGPTHYNLSFREVGQRWVHADNPGQWYCSQMVPSRVLATLLVQGEVMRDAGGLYLYCAFVPVPMRDALRHGAKEYKGLAAVTVLRHYLCPNSYSWLEQLLDLYPEHVVEFSTFRIPWGMVPHHNTVIWEVRRY